MTDREIEMRLRAELPPELFEHVLRTRVTAVEIAGLCGVDPTACDLAALLHDCCRHLPESLLLNLAGEFNIFVSDAEKDKPVLLHGPVGAEVARERFGITDGEVLDAVRYHTTGRAGMSFVEQVVYLADKMEPGKRRTSLPVSGRSGLRPAILDHVNRMIIRWVKNGLPIHPSSIEMRNWLLEARVED
ncbi:MAG: bis(5'-nucleosyl)-tetraphosphatase (symmetrical) YqeK [Bacillota bacterium]